MARNAYAMQMLAAKSALQREERKALVHRCLTTIYQASAIALNDEFGFGAERITRFRDAMESIILEYGVEMDNTDTEYADGKLEEAYLRIMGEYYKEEDQ